MENHKSITILIKFIFIVFLYFVIRINNINYPAYLLSDKLLKFIKIQIGNFPVKIINILKDLFK